MEWDWNTMKMLPFGGWKAYFQVLCWLRGGYLALSQKFSHCKHVFQRNSVQFFRQRVRLRPCLVLDPGVEQQLEAKNKQMSYKKPNHIW